MKYFLGYLLIGIIFNVMVTIKNKSKISNYDEFINYVIGAFVYMLLWPLALVLYTLNTVKNIIKKRESK